MFLWSSLCATVLLKDNLIDPILCIFWYKSTNQNFYQIIFWNIEATGFSWPSSVSHMSYLAWFLAWKRMHLFHSTAYFFHTHTYKTTIAFGPALPYNIFTIWVPYFSLTSLKHKSGIFPLFSSHGFDQILISQTLFF